MAHEYKVIKKVNDQRRFFMYLAPDSMDIAQLVHEGHLPMTKGSVGTLRSEGCIPSPIAKIVVFRKRANSRGYNLVSLCEATSDFKKAKGVHEKFKPVFKYVIEVREIYCGNAAYRKNPYFHETMKGEKLPTLMSITIESYQKYFKRFPLLVLSERISKWASTAKLDTKSATEYVWDPKVLAFTKVSDLLSRVDDDKLEDALKKRITTRQGYEMVNRLYKQAVAFAGKQLKEMHWADFEDICRELVEYNGMAVMGTQKTQDGGVDIYAMDERTHFRKGLYLFQVKRTVSVGVEVIKLLESTVHERNAVKGVILTTGVFTAKAREACQSRPIELIDGFELEKLFNELQSSQ